MKTKSTLKPYTSIKTESARSAHILLEKLLRTGPKLYTRKVNKPIILYGAGNLGRMAKSFFDYLNLPYLYTVDIYAKRIKANKKINRADVVHPLDVRNEDKQKSMLVVCIVNSRLIKIRDNLMNEGWKDIVFFYDLSQAYANMYPLNNGWVLGGLSAKEKKNIFQVFSKVGDQISRIHYTRFIAWRKMRIELLSELANVRTDNRFFIPEVLSVLNDSEVFVDCGAHVGSVSKKFVGIVKNRYRNMYIIEPDKINFSRVKKEFSKTVRTKLFKLSLGSKYGIRKFHEGFGFASKLSKIGNTKTKVSTLDSMKIPATFIKMHLEGGELDALRGATKTIRKFRPIIAVTLYHNSDGVFKIPLLLMSITNKYRYLIRTHSWAGTGVILYAIPNERNK